MIGDVSETKQMLSERLYIELRDAILRGDYHPGSALKPQSLADTHDVSLAVVREALVRLVGDGLADRLVNRGFVVPLQSDGRWREITEARRVFEPAALKLSVERGDLEWESRVRAAHHRLSRTAAFEPENPRMLTAAWTEAHREFHRALLEGCGNRILLDTFDRFWLGAELARRWSTERVPDRDGITEHRQLEEAALARDADGAAALLDTHLALTLTGLEGP